MRKKNKLIFGVGINDADYEVYKTSVVEGKSKKIWSCPYYLCWIGMLLRCYYEKYLIKHPTYRGTQVIDEWKRFSVFKAWMETQDWPGKELDKDLLVRGNKIYSPETCVFITQKLNTFLNERKRLRGEWPIGVSFEAGRNKFKARCSDPDTGKDVNLGRYDSSEEAHKAWLFFKLSKAKDLALRESDVRVSKALIDRYENYEGE